MGQDYQFKNEIYDAHSHGESGEADFRPSTNDRKIANKLRGINPEAKIWLFMPKNLKIKWQEL